MRLFAEQGYDATTIEQIAEAADVSPSTFFRYFPSKEDVIVKDDHDPLLISAFLAQPAALTPLGALRAAMREVLAEAFADGEETELQRVKLIWSIPSLRAREVEGRVTAMAMLTGALAQRTGRSADDFTVRVFAGAVIGAWIAAMESWVESDGAERLSDLVDRVLALLEEGLPL